MKSCSGNIPIVKSAALLVLSLVLSVLLGEAALRAAGFEARDLRINPFFVSDSDTTWSLPHAELGWINKPGVSQSIEEGHAPMTFWDFGRRATRPEAERPEGGYPVMIIGGSNAQSYGVRDENSFAYKLSERYPRLWIENFGNGGYSTVQALMLAEKAYEEFYTQAKPKLILLAFDDSHALRNVADQSWIYSISDDEGRYVAPPHYRIEGGGLVFHPFRTIGFWPLEEISALVTVLHNVWLQSFAYNTADQALEVTRRVISRLEAFAEEKDVKFAVTVLEDRSRITGSLFANPAFPFKDCSGLERTEPEKYLLGGSSHPNAKLHAHFASCIGSWLETEVLPETLSNSGQPSEKASP